MTTPRQPSWPPPNQPPTEKRRRRRVPVVIVALIAVLMAAGALAYQLCLPRLGTSSFGSQANAAAPQALSGGAPRAPSGAAPQTGILVATGGPGRSTQTYGFIDPNSGKYAEVASFNLVNVGTVSGEVGVSPDFMKAAGIKQNNVGWLDHSGNFTNVTPKDDTGAFGGNAPNYNVVGFDGAGNFYYIKNTSHAMEAYKLPAGSTAGAQMISSGLLTNYNGSLGYDGSMHIGCNGAIVNWLGPNNSVQSGGTQINKVAITGHDDNGCPTVDMTSATPLLPKTNTVTVTDAVGNHDGSKVAFKYLGQSSSGASETSLYIVSADGSSQPTKVNLTGLTGDQLSQMTLIKWI
jgi:hypothetical protein